MIIAHLLVYFWSRAAIVLIFLPPLASFQLVQPKSSRPATRLHQDSLLQEWWKAGSSTILAADVVVPTTVLFDWNKKDTTTTAASFFRPLGGGATEVQQQQPRRPTTCVSVVALQQDGYRRQRRSVVDHAENTAPGLGTFEFDEEDEEDAILNARQKDAEQVLSQRNRTRVAVSSSGLPGPQQKKSRSLLDAAANPSTNRNTTTTISTKKRGKAKGEAKAARDSLAALLPGRKSTDVLTVADMERILESQLVQQSQNKGKNRGLNAQGSSDDKTAFPQPSELSDRTVQWGTTAAAGFFGLILAASALPNLWLAGCVAGSVYGYGVKPNGGEDASTVSKFCTASGRQLARTYLKAYDAIITLVFLYKTGQLSYTYYQKYQVLDQRFGIQRKMDAWNARFAQGKRNFDAWERENEIGRKALAALRTAWLVAEEEQQHRQRRIPRVVQYTKRLFSLTLPGSTPRWVTAVVSAAAVGIVWAIVPASAVVGLFLLLGVYVWPTWLTEFGEQWRERFRNDMDTTNTSSAREQNHAAAARNRRMPPPQVLVRSERQQRSSSRTKPATAPQHYYRRNNGQRKYYRVGQPAWPWQPRIEEVQQQQQRWWWWKRRSRA